MRTTISDLFARLDDERGLSNLTSLLTESSDEGEVSTEYGRLRLLYLILSARNGMTLTTSRHFAQQLTFATAVTDWAQISDMSKLLVPLCERLLQTKNIKEWIVTSSCVQHILQLKVIALPPLLEYLSDPTLKYMADIPTRNRTPN